MYLYFVCKDENETHTQNKYDLSKVSESKWRIQVTGHIEEGYNSFKKKLCFAVLVWEGELPLPFLKNFFSTDTLKENNIYHH